MKKNIGKIVQIIGPVIDVIFEGKQSELPNILDALEIKRDDGQIIVVECEQHIGEHLLRLEFELREFGGAVSLAFRPQVVRARL